MLRHAESVINPFLKSLRSRVGLVMYSLPGKPDAIRKKLYRSFNHQPTAEEHKQGERELAQKLQSFTYRGQDIPREVDGEQDRDDPGRQDDELQLARVHQDRRSSTLGWCPGSDPARDVRRSGADDEGVASRPIARLS
jgi:hypothetical protein